MFLAGFDLVNALDGVEIYGVDGETVKGVGGHGDDVAFLQTGNDVIDPVCLGFIGMDAQDLRGQVGLPRISGPFCIGSRHRSAGLMQTLQTQTPQRRKLTQHQPGCKLGMGDGVWGLGSGVWVWTSNSTILPRMNEVHAFETGREG